MQSTPQLTFESSLSLSLSLSLSHTHTHTHTHSLTHVTTSIFILDYGHWALNSLDTFIFYFFVCLIPKFGWDTKVTTLCPKQALIFTFTSKPRLFEQTLYVAHHTTMWTSSLSINIFNISISFTIIRSPSLWLSLK